MDHFNCKLTPLTGTDWIIEFRNYKSKGGINSYGDEAKKSKGNQ